MFNANVGELLALTFRIPLLRPELGFNVELLDAIDIDTFGVDKLIADVIEDVLSKRE